MKRTFIAMLLAAALTTSAYAYDGWAIVTKDSEAKHGVQFDVTFQERDGILHVTVVAPYTAKSILLSRFTVIQMENDRITLRVPMAAAPWITETQSAEHLTFKLGSMSPKVTFSVSQARLPKTMLEVGYGSTGGSWTFVVDLSTYQSENKDATTKPSSKDE